MASSSESRSSSALPFFHSRSIDGSSICGTAIYYGRRHPGVKRFGIGEKHRRQDRRRYGHAVRIRRSAGGLCHRWVSGGYLPIIRMVNEPGTTVPCGPRPPRPLSGVVGGVAGAAGAGPRSWLIVKMWFVLLSNAMVRAPFMVLRFCSTSKLVGLFSLTTVSVPFPWVLKASFVAGLKMAPSDPPASGRLVRILPSLALRITIMGCAGWAGGLPELAHAANNTWFFASSASPLHLPLSPKG